jgi:5,10-methylenetetrahydrofolate reductase
VYNFNEIIKGANPMGKEFNISGACNPEKHYMVDISRTLAYIKVLVDKGAYFTMVVDAVKLFSAKI